MMVGGRQFRVAALALLALVAAACSPNVSASETTLPLEPEPTTSSSSPFPDVDPTVEPAVGAGAKTALAATLDVGASGEDVKRLQRRLLDLRFDPGAIDGQFGEMTAMAVWAYKKLVTGALAVGVDAKVTPELWTRMQDPLGWSPGKQGQTQNHFEVYLPQQVAVLVRNGVPALISHVSTGDGQDWCNKRRPIPDPNAPPDAPPPSAAAEVYCGKSVTPAGAYRFTAKRSGWFSGYYGDLYKPVFFNGGIAVHGFNTVPNRPASHGCVRIPNHIADYFQSLVRVGDQVFVFDGFNDPERLGAVPAPADIIDPRSTTTVPASTTAAPTTAKATTTVPKTTVAPTTVPATTTVAKTTVPATTTTTAAPPPATTSTTAA
jgi:hypothetical protein